MIAENNFFCKDRLFNETSAASYYSGEEKAEMATVQELNSETAEWWLIANLLAEQYVPLIQTHTHLTLSAFEIAASAHFKKRKVGPAEDLKKTMQECMIDELMLEFEALFDKLKQLYPKDYETIKTKLMEANDLCKFLKYFEVLPVKLLDQQEDRDQFISINRLPASEQPFLKKIRQIVTSFLNSDLKNLNHAECKQLSSFLRNENWIEFA